MTFGKLAEYLQKLDGTSSRLAMTEILADLFKNTNNEDARMAAYLVQGRLGPIYDNPDFGVGDKLMLRALGGDKAVKIFKEVGDLGKTAEKIKFQEAITKKQKNSNIQISEVYEKLVEIASAGGTGSQEIKQQLIVGLVEELDPVGAKYAVKMILGKLRGGFSDMTILDSLSYLITGDKSLREKIESMYNVRADLGEIAQIVKKNGIRINDYEVTPKIGTPVLMARAERAGSAAEIWERMKDTGCAAEYKLDGFRIQAHIRKSGVNLFSRGLEDVTKMYPDVADGLGKQLKTECIVEGEMIGVGEDGKYMDFQKTVQRKRKYNVLEKSKQVPLKFFLFDILVLDGKNLMKKPNQERWEDLKNVVSEGRVIELMPRKMIGSAVELKEFFDKAIADGTEGIMAKKLNGEYQAGSRDFNWIKLKSVLDSIDVLVMGYTAGEGKRSGFGIGEFLVGVYDSKSDKFLTVSKIGTGLTDKEWVEMKTRLDKLKVDTKPARYEAAKQYECDHWVKPNLVLEVQANEISVSPAHSSGYALRFPRLVGIREKKPEDATSVLEVAKIYSIQKGVSL